MPTLVHLVYIHGFQGNDTTFQSFPKHLQEYLSSNIPPHLDITIQSSLYPTYKSVKPISHATKNFLEWLSTQPPGPVILLGHSMGGLLAAEAATDPTNNPPNALYKSPGKKTMPKRIVGVVAFDTPYLGMHPHVVITGIASLLPKKEGDKGKGEDKQQSEKKMNEHPQVQIVDEKVTDDWESFKKQTHVQIPKSSYASSESSYLNSQDSLGSSSSLRTISPSPPPPSQFVDRALSFISDQNNGSVARWIRKHADDPISAAKRWVIEHFQFGICMFDPSGLKTRYTRLISWEEEGGMWVNYWTNTVPQASEVPAAVQGAAEQIDNDDALRANGILPPSMSPPEYSFLPSSQPAQEVETKAEQKGKTKSPKKKKSKQARHFVVLPNGLGQVLGGLERWEQVPISGVDDEVNAHTGLFIPHQNVDYDALVERVANRILGWCERLPKVNYE